MGHKLMRSKDAMKSNCPACGIGVTTSGRHAPMITNDDGVALCGVCARKEFPQIVELRGTYEALRHFVVQAVSAGLLTRETVASIYETLDD